MCEGITNLMEDNAMQSSVQGLEQTIGTIFACRGVVKYNSALSEAQKNELLADIDSSLLFLRERLVEHISAQKKLRQSQFQQAILPVANVAEKSFTNKDKST